MNRDLSIYLDHNATTHMYDEAIAAFQSCVEEPLNASSIHSLGKKGKRILETARSKVSDFMGLNRSYQLIFANSATEANNIALRGLAHEYAVITTPVEHPSVFNTVGEGIMPVDQNGIVDLQKLEGILKHHKKVLFSVILANNETGIIQPIEKIIKICHENDAIIHIDASQAFGKISINIAEYDVDLVTMSGHKMGAGFGCAGLAFKKSLPILPIMQGGAQELKLIPGTHNIPAINALAAVCEQKFIDQYKQVKQLRDYIEKDLLDFCPDIVIFGKEVYRLPNTSSIAMLGIDSQTQVVHFDMKGIMLSAGAACASGKVEVPRIHLSMGYFEEIAKCAIRVSIGLSNTKEDVDLFLEHWKELYLQSRNV